MKNKLVTILMLMIAVFSVLPCFAGQTAEYKFVPIKDGKTNIEIARTLVPDNFEVKSTVTWERNFKEPALITISANSKDDEILFFFSSAKSYVDISSDNYTNLHAGKQDPTLRVFRKKFLLPEEYIFETVSSTNPSASEIKLISSDSCSQELVDYLTSELYQSITEIEVNTKTDKRASKIKITSPLVKPYIATYTYKIGEKLYKQTFITMFTSMDFNYTAKTSYDDYETIVKKLWRNSGFYSFRAEEKLYDKYLEDFVIFMSNSMINQKAQEAVEQVKKQMVMEINPSYVDIHTGSRLKKLPSELFRRYYSGGAPDYSEEQSAQKPTIQETRWLSEVFMPQTCFNYRKITNIWRQNVYVPKKYTNVYYNTIGETIVISTDKQKLNGAWIKLKEAKFDYSK